MRFRDGSTNRYSSSFEESEACKESKLTAVKKSLL